MKIVVEGIDGAGKTTISKYISTLGLEYIKFPRYEFIPVIKKHLTGEIVLDDRVTVMLFLADILDGTKDKNKYVADRSFFSTIAYSRLDVDKLIRIIMDFDVEFPDYVIYLDVDIDTALLRIAKKYEKSVYDKDVELLNRVKKRYDELFSHREIADKTRVIKIDARKSIDLVIEDVSRSIKL